MHEAAQPVKTRPYCITTQDPACSLMILPTLHNGSIKDVRPSGVSENRDWRRHCLQHAFLPLDVTKSDALGL